MISRDELRRACTFCFDAIPIESSLPSLLKIFCAVGRSKIASVAPPSELTPPKRTVPDDAELLDRAARQNADRVADA